MLSCFAGGVLVAPLCGEPLLAAFADGAKVLIASLLWFLIYYTPHDLTYHVRILNAYFIAYHLNSVKKIRENEFREKIRFEGKDNIKTKKFSTFHSLKEASWKHYRKFQNFFLSLNGSE
jgi:hypothetical protein